MGLISLFDSLAYLRDGEGGCLGHLALGAEEGVALEGLIPVSRDEGEHVVEGGVGGAVADPGEEDDGHDAGSPVDGVVHQHRPRLRLHHLDPLQRHRQADSLQAPVQLLRLWTNV